MLFCKRRKKVVLGKFKVLAESPCGNFHVLLVGLREGEPFARILDLERARVTEPLPLESVLGHGHGYWQPFSGDLAPIQAVLPSLVEAD